LTDDTQTDQATEKCVGISKSACAARTISREKYSKNVNVKKTPRQTNSALTSNNCPHSYEKAHKLHT